MIEAYNLDLKIFYNEVPKMNNIIDEIPMDDLNLVVDKMGVIIENAHHHKSYLFNMKDVMEFIKLCVKLSVEIINDIK